MANAEEGQVGFQADGKEWTLEITNRTERSIQVKLKCSMGEVMKRLGDGDVTILQAVFHEALKKHHPTITEFEAIDLVSPRQIRKLVGDILATTYPTAEEKQNPPQPDQAGETGSAS